MPLSGIGPLGADRWDFHNVSVDVEFAQAGYCGMTHLQSGRICIRPARHTGSCDFRRRDEALAVLRARAVAARESRL